MNCPECGKNIQNPKKFCPYCRNPLVGKSEPTSVIDTTFVEPYAGMEFVLIKHGCFDMGDTFGDGGDDEKPVRKVCITKDFYMGKYQVTQGQWVKVMGKNPSNFQSGDDYPVEQVNWNDAQEFIADLNDRGGGKYRLPTEAEWEYACREGGRKARFGTGEDRISPSTANFDARPDYKKPYSDVGEYRKKTTPVGSFKPNGLGLYDMSGNVWEWVEDAYDKDAYSKLGENDPVNTGDIGSNRVIRGGSWNYNPDYLRCSLRYSVAPSVRYFYVGFRIVRDR